MARGWPVVNVIPQDNFFESRLRSLLPASLPPTLNNSANASIKIDKKKFVKTCSFKVEIFQIFFQTITFQNAGHSEGITKKIAPLNCKCWIYTSDFFRIFAHHITLRNSHSKKLDHQHERLRKANTGIMLLNFGWLCSEMFLVCVKTSKLTQKHAHIYIYRAGDSYRPNLP